ncbi:alpha-2-macroglobulin family protein [Kordiimonas marina]|uniref:alpha-2-macroglobulin family protein n=1 Tax=Kordiimonas marina TaxID=2872312 RepID=UPI001FF6A63E|nr:alpha-2-macroglobulin [Kordiimonas marina]MCJ9427534.1 alpha-2-macroglobulin family protein [Kordiimonas marina]
MRRFATLLLIALVCLATPLLPSAKTMAGDITSPTVLEDRSATAARLLEAAKQRVHELETLEAAKSVDGLNLSDALKQGLPPTPPEGSIKDFKKRYSAELQLAQHANQSYPWRNAAEAWLKVGRLDDAYGAAWHLLHVADNPGARAGALDTFVKILLADHKPEEALTTLREAQAVYPIDSRQIWLNSVEDRFTLRITDQTVDTEGKSPRACLVFSHPLRKTLPIPVEDYVRVTGGRDVSIQAEHDRICLMGLTYGDKMEVTVLAGLPGEEGTKLYKDTTRTIVISDRPARLVFGNGTYILPKVGDETVPLKSVNVDTASLALFRVPDRGLVPWMNSGLEGKNLNGWAQENLGNNIGEKVWKGHVDIDTVKNEDVTTLVPIRDMLKTKKPGIYALVATPGDGKQQQEWEPQQTQWVVISDLGIMTLQGADGLHVFVNSLETAKPLKNVTIKVIARNNDILADVQTDRDGQATIAAEQFRGTGGNLPMALTASTSKGDYNFIKLQGAALDMSDRGTEGRKTSGPLDAFLYTERGIYRPGETVFLSGLLRDAQARAVGKLPLTLVITRPDGVEAVKKRITGDSLGAYAFDYGLSPAARTGLWRVSLLADNEAQSVGETHFQVDDFVPERLSAKLDTLKNQLSAGVSLEVHVQADFLYGAPGADLTGTLSTTLAADPAPFKEWKRYHFGLVQDEFSGEKLNSLPLKTDATGLARVALVANKLPDTTLPLRAKLTAEIQDVGGRPVQDAVWLPVKHAPVMLGVRAEQDGSFEENTPAALSVVAVDGNGKPLTGKNLTAVWVKEHYSYTWYQSRNRWQYRPSFYDETMGEEQVRSGMDGTVQLSRTLPWGRYRLDVRTPDGKAAASARFTVGWWAASQSPDVPDGLELSLKSTALKSGDRVHGHVKAPFEGIALITVANDRVLAHKTIHLSKEGGDFDFKVKKDWGPSAYILATALRPDAGAISRLPIRATGLTWFSIDRKARSKAIVFDVPKTALPGQKITIPIRLEGERPPGEMKVTVTAVDEGILNITRFKTPSADAFYFGKRWFAFDIRDIYGRLIRSEAGKRGKIRTGGGGLEEVVVTGSRVDRNSPTSNLFNPMTRTTKTVALISRNISLDDKGEGSVTLTLPDFSGKLRLMAVATSVGAVGTGKADLTVRTPVVADLITPRFLAPGDQAQATLSVQNLSGQDGTFTVQLETLSQAIGLQAPQETVTLKNGERRDLTIPLQGITVGTAGIDLAVTGGTMTPVHRHYDISVRAAWPYVTQRNRFSLTPGKTGTADGIALSSFYKGTVSQDLVVTSRPNLEAGRLFQDLDDYPYRCSEQTVSRAMPNLFFKELNSLYKMPSDNSHAANTVERAIARLLDRQRSDGSFGLWNSFGSRYDWLDVYVTDFLLRARDKGYFVSDSAISLALSRLKRMVANRGQGFPEAQAYAHYVLARYGDVSASEVRYFADQFAPKLRSPLAIAQIAGALKIMGEADLSARLMVKAVHTSRKDATLWGDYGSRLRDLAAITTILKETGVDASLMADLADGLEASVAKNRWLNTQEMAWLSRAAAAFAGNNASEMTFAINGTETKAKHGFWQKIFAKGTNLATTSIINTSDTSLRVVHSVRGIPKAAPDEVSHGFRYARSYYDLQGHPISPDSLPRNGRFVVLLWGQADAEAIEDPLLVDLLPAGLEIDSTDTSDLSFLGDLTSVEFSDARDDRFVAALKIVPFTPDKYRSFRVAYIVRAITPGTYVMPGPFVEDMYKPRFRYQGKASQLVVKE